MRAFNITSESVKLADFNAFVFQRSQFSHITIDANVAKRIEASRQELLRLIETRTPLYGVTTGFGDSVSRHLPPTAVHELQKNLVDYLTCGSGALLSVEACRGALLARLVSLTRGYSGVRWELVDRLKLYLEKDWIPVIPSEGSLGASGDLIPLAYIAQCLQGQGLVYFEGQQVEIAKLLESEKLTPLSLEAKEGLALVNGTSAMLGVCAVNLKFATKLLDLAATASAWTCLALDGRTEAFSDLVNKKASRHDGQSQAAEKIIGLLKDEDYSPIPIDAIHPVQDRYSLRCSPQILGPVVESLSMIEKWITDELNTTSDNPLISPDKETEGIATGGNFYGGYLSHSMDYLKICIAQIADMCDRQLILVMDEKSNRGLPANLANWPAMNESEKFLHHGLKALHQSASALTSEICALSMPNGVFSRSAECHNQDKVSLGMSAANQCSQMLAKSYTLIALQLICLAQALDLKKLQLKGEKSHSLYRQLRSLVDFADRDRAMATPIQKFVESLKDTALATEKHL